MTPRTSPTFRRRQLARRIRQLREQSGLNQGEAASGLDMSKSALSRKETGDAATSVHEVRSMMDLYDHYDPELIELARAAKQKGWWRDYGIKDRGYVDLETDATSVREAQLSVVPGLLQTEEYMRHLFAAGGRRFSADIVEREVAVRMLRQQRLTDREDPLRLQVVLTEHALRSQVGGSPAMARQLREIVQRGDLPTVAVQVFPSHFGGCATLSNSFALLSYSDKDERDVFYVEHAAGSLHSARADDVRAATIIFDDACDQSLNHQESLRFIERVAGEFEGDRHARGTSL